jgi:hypothetical protein
MRKYKAVLINGGVARWRGFRGPSKIEASHFTSRSSHKVTYTCRVTQISYFFKKLLRLACAGLSSRIFNLI